jgi:hypothetical protein
MIRPILRSTIGLSFRLRRIVATGLLAISLVFCILGVAFGALAVWTGGDDWP